MAFVYLQEWRLQATCANAQSSSCFLKFVQNLLFFHWSDIAWYINSNSLGTPVVRWYQNIRLNTCGDEYLYRQPSYIYCGMIVFWAVETGFLSGTLIPKWKLFSYSWLCVFVQDSDISKQKSQRKVIWEICLQKFIHVINLSNNFK